MSSSLLDKLSDKIESSKGSPVKMFLLGVLASLVVWLVSRSRRKMVHRKEYLQKRSEALAAVDLATKTEEEQTKILQTIRLNKNAAKVVSKKISAVDKKIEDTKRRIKSARSIDDLEDL